MIGHVPADARTDPDLRCNGRVELDTYLAEARVCSWTAARARDGLDPRTAYESCAQYRELLVRSNLHLVAQISMAYVGQGLCLARIVEEGHQGLIRAAVSYDASRGMRFSAFASWWIKQAIRRALAEPSCGRHGCVTLPSVRQRQLPVGAGTGHVRPSFDGPMPLYEVLRQDLTRAQADGVDLAQDRIMAQRSVDGRPPSHGQRRLEWRLLLIGAPALILAGGAWAIAVGTPIGVVVGVAVVVLLVLLMAGSPVWGAGVSRGREESAARVEALDQLHTQERRDPASRTWAG